MAAKKKSTENKGGRPTKFKTEYSKQALKLTKLGATDKQLADFFEVTETTINNWKIEFPAFFESLKEGKDETDNRVERALYERATGYSHPDTKFATWEGAITDSKEYTKHYPPDATSCIFWLKNRRPEQWREKPEGENNDNDLADALNKLTDKLPS